MDINDSGSSCCKIWAKWNFVLEQSGSWKSAKFLEDDRQSTKIGRWFSRMFVFGLLVEGLLFISQPCLSYGVSQLLSGAVCSVPCKLHESKGAIEAVPRGAGLFLPPNHPFKILIILVSWDTRGSTRGPTHHSWRIRLNTSLEIWTTF